MLVGAMPGDVWMGITASRSPLRGGMPPLILHADPAASKPAAPAEVITRLWLLLLKTLLTKTLLTKTLLLKTLRPALNGWLRRFDGQPEEIM